MEVSEVKAYVLEYDIQVGNKVEHRIETTTNLTEFIKWTNSKLGKWYISNVKTYVGTVAEIDPSKVVDPF